MTTPELIQYGRPYYSSANGRSQFDELARACQISLDFGHSLRPRLYTIAQYKLRSYVLDDMKDAAMHAANATKTFEETDL